MRIVFNSDNLVLRACILNTLIIFPAFVYVESLEKCICFENNTYAWKQARQKEFILMKDSFQ